MKTLVLNAPLLNVYSVDYALPTPEEAVRRHTQKALLRRSRRNNELPGLSHDTGSFMANKSYRADRQARVSAGFRCSSDEEDENPDTASVSLTDMGPNHAKEDNDEAAFEASLVAAVRMTEEASSAATTPDGATTGGMFPKLKRTTAAALKKQGSA